MVDGSNQPEQTIGPKPSDNRERLKNGGNGIQPSDMDNSIERLNWEEIRNVLKGDGPVCDLRCN
ncbi:MAG: hypothetical protein RIC03_16310 [Cyclobacteriaceae bacterium]